MLDIYEQKVLIEYLVNAIEYMRRDDSSFCIEKISNLIDVVHDVFKTKQIGFNLKENIDYNSFKNVKKLHEALSYDVIAQLKSESAKLKINKISAKEKTFRILQKIFKLNDEEINVFKMFCRNELDDIKSELGVNSNNTKQRIEYVPTLSEY